MTGEDLYREVPCRKCGKMRLAVATFCPHCGEVTKESSLKAFAGVFRSTEPAIPQEKKRGKAVLALMGTLIGGYFIYLAIQGESLQDLIVGLLSLYYAFRAWFSEGKATRDSDAVRVDPPKEVIRKEPAPSDVLEDKFFCENCGSQVEPFDVECPKCGMKFGS